MSTWAIKSYKENTQRSIRAFKSESYSRSLKYCVLFLCMLRYYCNFWLDDEWSWPSLTEAAVRSNVTRVWCIDWYNLMSGPVVHITRPNSCLRDKVIDTYIALSIERNELFTGDYPFARLSIYIFSFETHRRKYKKIFKLLLPSKLFQWSESLWYRQYLPHLYNCGGSFGLDPNVLRP